MMYRQGEILLIKVEETPSQYIETPGDSALLGIGETGNAHTLTAVSVDWLHSAIEDINKIKINGVVIAQEPVYIRVAGDAVIRHSDRVQGHHELAIPDGAYLVRIKREQLPWEEQARYVAD
jgi:hypothetical protein